MRHTKQWLGLAIALVGAGCANEKAPVTDEFSALAQAKGEGKADAIDDMIVGSLKYGENTPSIKYFAPPLYRIVKFAAHAGDSVEIKVNSTNGGDAVAWLLDDDFNVLAFNDDASSSTLNAKITATIPEHVSQTHYIVFRDYWYETRRFKVYLQGEESVATCQKDSDCMMVEMGCCAIGNWTAIHKDQAESFEAAKNCPANPICPLMPIVYKGESAICEFETSQCKVVLPSEIACGGHTINPHGCPDGWQCMGAGLAWDAPGECIKTCGGFGGFACPENLNCVDDPNDDCDPQNGGADCGGICVTGDAPDCKILGCQGETLCQPCSGEWMCLPPNTQC